jgi:O-antigen/teichoic acid export membrane protein
MAIFTYISFFEAIAKLTATILLTIAPEEKLITYGILILVVSLTTTLTYLIIAKIRYPTCTFKKNAVDKKIFKEIVVFTGWTLFGHLTTVARNQAITILLNQTFNPAVAAARAISTTVASHVNIFSTNFNTSLYPPIVKYYSANQREEMFSILIWGSKLTFFLMWIFALPLYLEMETILTLWLVIPPPEATYFSQLALIEAIIMSVSLPIATAARAPGQMRLYESTLGSIQLLIFLISWLLLSLGHPAESVFFVAIAANVLMFFTRLFIVSSLIGLIVSVFLKKVVVPLLYVAFTSSASSFLVKMVIPSSLLGSAIIIIFSISISTILMLCIGFDKITRSRLKAQIKVRLMRLL